MFKVNNEDTRTTPLANVSILNFEQVNAYWVRNFQSFLFFRSLDACGCNKITDKGVCSLAKRCTKLTILDLSSTKVTSRRYAFYNGFSHKYQNVKALKKYFMIMTLYILVLCYLHPIRIATKC